MRLKHLPLLLALASASLPALADDVDTLIAAREAARRDDPGAIALAAQQLSGGHPLADYPAYWLAEEILSRNSDSAASQYLATRNETVLSERLRNSWLKQLGKRRDWPRFATEQAKVGAEYREPEVRCYGELMLLQQNPRAAIDWRRFLDGSRQPEGCETLLVAGWQQRAYSADWAALRTRQLLANNNVTAARNYALQTGLSLNDGALTSLLKLSRSEPHSAARQLEAAGHDAATTRFVWGVIGLSAARDLDSVDALAYYAKADPAQLNDEQWEWWARSALRTGQWNLLETITADMPANLAGKSNWRYWRARALLARGRSGEANPLLVEASRGYGFYSLLAQEELGASLSSTPQSYQPNERDLQQAQNEPAVRRSLLLLDIAERRNVGGEWREDAKREWRWAMRGKSDEQLLAAAEVARRSGFYDMAIYSAERTVHTHDVNLRYLAPFRSITRRYASQLDVEEAWIYGLIRQESRFVSVARSGVGANGLMQLMPATANWVANKVGLGNGYSIHDIDTNIQLGTWYLHNVYESLGHEVLATAAYNAGPGRARRWQAGVPLEGAIYAETIPFNETRDYVQKVMANASYYAQAFGQGPRSLKARMGTIAAR